MTPTNRSIPPIPTARRVGALLLTLFAIASLWLAIKAFQVDEKGQGPTELIEFFARLWGVLLVASALACLDTSWRWSTRRTASKLHTYIILGPVIGPLVLVATVLCATQ